MPDDAPIGVVFPYRAHLGDLNVLADDMIRCQVAGDKCTPENLNPALGCREGLARCAPLWDAVTSQLVADGSAAQARTLDDSLELHRLMWAKAGRAPTHVNMAVDSTVQTRLFMAIPHTLAVREGLVGMRFGQTMYNPNGLRRFYIHLDRREMPFKAGQMWLERAHVALRPDGFRVWSAGAAEPVWIPRPSPDDGWRELIAASAELDPRGYDSDTLVIALQPEVRFWVLWRALALIGLRYPDGAFDGAADLDAVRPRMDGDEPERRFRRVWLTVDSTD